MAMRVFDPLAREGLRSATPADLEAADGRATLWLDLNSPTPAEIEELGRRFSFHPLALEDARRRQQRPKIDAYPNHLFIVLYALALDGEGEFERREIALFVTQNAVVSVHWGTVPEIEQAADRWAEHYLGGLAGSTAMLVYAIVDTIVDGYFPFTDELGERIDELENAVFTDASQETLERVFRIKRELLEVRRVVAPTRDVFNAFTRRELPLLGEHSVVYYQDVYDHVIRITDTIDNYRDILSSIIDVHLTVVSNRLNQTVRTLTAWSIILMSLALVAGIYGMNFRHMPELEWRLGYAWALALMGTVAGVEALIFRRLGWW